MIAVMVAVVALVVTGMFALTLVVTTGLGAHRRGCRLPLAMVAAIGFPVTWMVWYIRDVHPYSRHV